MIEPAFLVHGLDKIQAITQLCATAEAAVPGLKAAVAGGYVRDTLLGLPRRDIDMLVDYSHTTSHNPWAIAEKLKVALGYEISRDFLDSYGNTEDIEAVFKLDGPLGGRPLDLIFSGDIPTAVSRFPVWISQVYVTSEGLHMTSTFANDAANKELTFQTNASDDYRHKIVAKFPSHKPC